MSLERFCRKEVATVAADETVAAAARNMRAKHVGAVVVIDGYSRPVGMLTDRDISCRVVAEGIDPRTVLAATAMSRNLVSIKRTDTIDQAAFSMRQHGIRRVPIVDGDGRLCGLVAFDDLVVLLSAELSQTVAALRENRGP
jgi:CBS domain-containing protein